MGGMEFQVILVLVMLYLVIAGNGKLLVSEARIAAK